MIWLLISLLKLAKGVIRANSENGNGKESEKGKYGILAQETGQAGICPG